MREDHKLQFYQKRIKLLEKEVKELKAENSVMSVKNGALVDELAEKNEQMEAMRLTCAKTERQLADEIYHAEEIKRAYEQALAEITAIKIGYMREMDTLLNNLRNHQ